MVMPNKLPATTKHGTTWSSGTIKIRFHNAAINSDGSACDVIMSFQANVAVLNQNGYNTGMSISNPEAVFLNISPDGTTNWLDAYWIYPHGDLYTGSVGYKWPNDTGTNTRLALCCRHVVSFSVVKPNTTTVVSGTMVMPIQDLNIADRTTGTYTGTYAEGIKFLSGAHMPVYANSNATIAITSDRIHGTANVENAAMATKSIAVLVDSTVSYEWHGGHCGTRYTAATVHPTGHLKVSKTTTGTGADTSKAFSFKVTFSGTSAPAAQSFTLANGQSKTIYSVFTQSAPSFCGAIGRG